MASIRKHGPPPPGQENTAFPPTDANASEQPTQPTYSDRELREELNEIKSSLLKLNRDLQSIKAPLDNVPQSAPATEATDLLSDLNSKLQAIETRLEELAQSAALTEASASDSEKLSQISRDVAQIEYQLSQRMTAVNSKMSGIAAMDKKIDALQDGLNSVRDSLSSRASRQKEQLEPIRTKMEKLEESCRSVLDGVQWKTVEQHLKTVQDLQEKLLNVSGELKAERNAAKRKETGSCPKVYVAWTVAFAFLLIFSALFMAGDFPYFGAHRELMISALTFFCVSVVGLIVSNVLTASASSGFFASKTWRMWYYFICGAVVLTSFVLSFILLLV